MNNLYILPIFDSRTNLSNVGGKGASLSLLGQAGFPVPDGFHVTTAAYRRFVEQNDLQSGILTALEAVDVGETQTLEAASQQIFERFAAAKIPDDIAHAVVHAYAALPGRSPAVAVRSSATAEDLPEASFAGQQETFLNVSGAEAVLQATRKCWASLWTARAIGYRMRQGIDPQGVALAVVVQQLVPAEAAGILFTANPVNGNREQVVISASWGLGEAVVGGLVTPDTLTLEKSTGSVISRETAEKRVQTTRVNGGTKEVPVPESLRNIPVLSDSQAAELANLGVRIEEQYGLPMDVEWTLTDGRFAIVQARPITALPEPPIQWIPPKPKGTYMRASVVDLMPAPLSPLFITLGIPSLRKQMQPLGKRLVGAEPVLAEDFFTSINTYAYMNHAIPLKSIGWILTGLLPAYPRLLGKLVPVWREELHPDYRAFVSRMEEHQPDQMSAADLWKYAQGIVDAVAYYVCGLMFATMGASAGSEGLLTRVYEKLVQRDGDPAAASLLMGWDNIPVRADKALYDLAMWCSEHPALSSYVLDTTSDQLVAQFEEDQLPSGVDENIWRHFHTRFRQHVKQYGYIIYQLDFAHELPLDHPEPMLETVKMYLRGEGTNPHERQRTSEANRIRTTQMALDRLKGLKRWVFRKALNWGQSMAEVREDALAEIGLGYPILRVMLRELGKRFNNVGAIQHPDDIFWLEKDEIDRLVDQLERSDELANVAGRVVARKKFRDKAKQETPPPMMPVKKRVMGIKTDVFIPHSEDQQTGNTLKGVPTSGGQVTATARVLHGPEDFDQMRPGDILVAGTTTPAWTPLFSMASAVVTDVGGPLSHGSIVAREFGIPAVMGTGVATKRIETGQTIRVDGNAGMVIILNGSSQGSSSQSL